MSGKNVKQNPESKDPAVLWYFGDWLGGTILMNRAMKGAYFDLLCAQFNNGHMTEAEIRILLHVDFPMWEAGLKKKFKKDKEGLFYNERLEKEMGKRKVFRDSRIKNLSKTGRDENETTDKNDYIDQILKIWCDVYLSERGREYEIVNNGKERQAIGKLATLYKKHHPDASTEEAEVALRKYFKSVLNIGNDWLRKNMSPSLIVSKFNEINNEYEKHRTSIADLEEIARRTTETKA